MISLNPPTKSPPTKSGKLRPLNKTVKLTEYEPITDSEVLPIFRHLTAYKEEPFDIIKSYFKEKHLERLVRHQIESYNHFIGYQIEQTIQQFNPLVIHYDDDYVAERNQYFLEIDINFRNFKLFPPQIFETNGATRTMYPQEARLRNFTYSSTATIDLEICYTIRDTIDMAAPKTIHKYLPNINIGKIPIMLKSSICVLKNAPAYITNECPIDCGGYFIIKGSEKVVLGQERAAENRVYCFDGKTSKWSWYAEIKSIPDSKCVSPKQIEMMIANKTNTISITIPRIKQPIELFTVFRALGVETDKAICEYITLGINVESNKGILNFLKPSIIEANRFPTVDDSIKHISTLLSYTPPSMMGIGEANIKKKRDFVIDLLSSDLFPHCHTLKQKLYFLGTMTLKLIQTALGLRPPDDRDCYINKRIELTGTLLNNLFRNYFNKMVKELQKLCVKEIQAQKTRTFNDYGNLINMTNIYKLIKAGTIESGILRALSTGDFSVKQSNNSKVGVGQVLNRLTYPATLSHIRRINTPIDKSGELLSPRKLHNSTWGFIDPVETPEGASIGLVKNLAYMTHITIPSSSAAIYDAVKPLMVPLDDCEPAHCLNVVKVIINGAWVGITDYPLKLYLTLKQQKYMGVIQVYTSIVFDYKSREIRVCNDGGRLTRPLLRVANDAVTLTDDVMSKLRNNELCWNDLLTNMRIPESVIEYIDVEEQEYAMIAMCDKMSIKEPDMYYHYTHCEIHPSTVLGVLSSCIPFPEHNQSPRNTYECLDIEETVMLASGERIPIKYVQVGDRVVTFNPETFEMSATTVVGHYIRPNTSQRMCLQTISGRRIVATASHKFMTDKGWRTVAEIKADYNSCIGLYVYGDEYNEIDELGSCNWQEQFSMHEFNRCKQERYVDIQMFYSNIVFKKRCVFIPVISVEAVADGLVSDIEVASGNHSFIAGDGFLSSNCAQIKQAIGIYALNYAHRMDKTAYVMTYPSNPLTDTRLMRYLQMHKAPSGCQITVAIMIYNGYNQEDSLLMNKGSIDRGMFLSTIYHTEKDEDKNTIRDEIIRTNPKRATTRLMKLGNYGKLMDNGFMPENTLVENNDIIISKIVPIKENRNDPTKIIKFEDQSHMYKTTEESYIDKNYTNRNGDGYNFAKTRIRTLRPPVIGDKFCALPTQQVLTDCGWIPICDLDVSLHKVCTLGRDGNMCYEYPSAKYIYPHDGDMVHIENKQVKVICTLNHKLYVEKRHGGKGYELIEAQDVLGKMVRFQKSMNNVYPDVPVIRLGSVEYKMDDWLQLLGMYISDGSTNGCSVQIACVKQRKIDFNISIFTKLGLEYKYNTGNDSFRVVLKSKYPEIYDELHRFGVAFNKFLPDYVWTLSRRQSLILLDALLQGDGSTMQYKGEDEFSRYHTISPQLADDVMRLCTHCGYSGIIKIKCEPDGREVQITHNYGERIGQTHTLIRRHTYYAISIIRSQNQPWINKKKNPSNIEQLIHYTGNVYCIEMDSSHVYYMRESKNSPSIIVGNSSKLGQKGTVGTIIQESDMPFTKEGVKPDLILNPHAIPSRMTIGQLKESLLGKVLIELGMLGDGTAFNSLSVETIQNELLKLGYNHHGNEIMYSGFDGRQFETSVFIGPTYYQRLKHMVNDKQHSRAFGPVVNLTRQPQEGRSHDGGFRVGEMERDVLIAHGISNFTKERLCDVSDKFSTYTCNRCGGIPAFNNGDDKNLNKKNGGQVVHRCYACDNLTDFSRVEIPYAFKLLMYELQTINVKTRLITEQ
jgi:DNA-directed RNA polymerase beta subunit